MLKITQTKIAVNINIANGYKIVKKNMKLTYCFLSLFIDAIQKK